MAHERLAEPLVRRLIEAVHGAGERREDRQPAPVRELPHVLDLEHRLVGELVAGSVADVVDERRPVVERPDERRPALGLRAGRIDGVLEEIDPNPLELGREPGGHGVAEIRVDESLRNARRKLVIRSEDGALPPHPTLGIAQHRDRLLVHHDARFGDASGRQPADVEVGETVRRRFERIAEGAAIPVVAQELRPAELPADEVPGARGRDQIALEVAVTVVIERIEGGVPEEADVVRRRRPGMQRIVDEIADRVLAPEPPAELIHDIRDPDRDRGAGKRPFGRGHGGMGGGEPARLLDHRVVGNHHVPRRVRCPPEIGLALIHLDRRRRRRRRPHQELGRPRRVADRRGEAQRASLALHLRELDRIHGVAHVEHPGVGRHPGHLDGHRARASRNHHFPPDFVGEVEPPEIADVIPRDRHLVISLRRIDDRQHVDHHPVLSFDDVDRLARDILPPVDEGGPGAIPDEGVAVRRIEARNRRLVERHLHVMVAHETASRSTCSPIAAGEATRALPPPASPR